MEAADGAATAARAVDTLTAEELRAVLATAEVPAAGPVTTTRLIESPAS